jgi:hypothetical protein
MPARCAENVDRFAAIDCSSPMSGVDPPEDRQHAARGRGHVQAALRHQRQQADRLERDRLAAGVRVR